MAKIAQEQQTTLDNRNTTRAQTPIPPTHPVNPKLAQQQIQTLISQGQLNAAFKQVIIIIIFINKIT